MSHITAYFVVSWFTVFTIFFKIQKVVSIILPNFTLYHQSGMMSFQYHVISRFPLRNFCWLFAPAVIGYLLATTVGSIF